MLPPDDDDRLRDEDERLREDALLPPDELERLREPLDRFDDDPLLLPLRLLLDRLEPELLLLLPAFERDVVPRRELLRPEPLEREDERPLRED